MGDTREDVNGLEILAENSYCWDDAGENRR
jgi:hypothetical protein